MTDWSQIANAWDGLVTVFKAAFPIEPDIVIDGPPTTDLPPRYVLVGVDPGVSGSGVSRPGLPSATGLQAISDQGNEEVTEQFAINCSCSAYSGDTDAQTQRRAALALFSTCAQAIAADRTLGGVLAKPNKAIITSYAWYVDNGVDNVGYSVTVNFAVTVTVEFVNWQGT